MNHAYRRLVRGVSQYSHCCGRVPCEIVNKSSLFWAMQSHWWKAPCLWALWHDASFNGSTISINTRVERALAYILAASLGIKSLYEFLYGTVGLFRVRAQNIDSCRRYPDELLNKIDQLRKKPFARCALWARHCIIRGKKWPECSVFTRNNCITEGFYRKMKLVQRHAYGFRNFENYRLRVRVLCCWNSCGELIRNLSERLAFEGACRLSCRATFVTKR